jgi:hypothetical protein
MSAKAVPDDDYAASSSRAVTALDAPDRLRRAEVLCKEMAEMTERYLEDFEVAQTFGGSGRIRVNKEPIKSFAAEFDPSVPSG